MFDISQHNYDDATFQQLVGSLVEATIDFSYTPVEVNGINIGVITIQPSPQRFHVLSKDYPDDRGGRYLEKGDLRIRTGSSKGRPTAWDYQRFRDNILRTSKRYPELKVSFQDGSCVIDAQFRLREVHNYAATVTLPEPPRKHVAPVSLRMVLSNIGQAPAENVLVESEPSQPDLHLRHYKNEIGEGWKVSSVANTNRLRFERSNLLHNDTVIIAYLDLYLRERNKQYEIQWRASAASMQDECRGVLQVNYQ